MGRARLLVSACAIALVAAACYDPKAYVLGPDVAAFLKLEPSAPNLPADGNSRLTIVATLTNASTTNDKKVGQVISFATSGGTILAGSKTANKTSGPLDVAVDASGRATVELQADSTIQTTRVQATINGITQILDVPFVAPTADNVITLVTTSNSLPANGYARLRLTATVKLALDPSSRVVTFKTSAGTLVGAGTSSNSGKQLDITADATGVAVADLQSTTVVESAFVSPTLAGITRTITIAFNAATPGDTINLVAGASTAQADGVSPVTLVATIAAGVVERTVTFRAAGAVFTNTKDEMTAVADGSNVARVNLVSPTTAVVAQLQATVMGTSAFFSSTFTPAQPDALLVSAHHGTIASSGTTEITVTLLRSIGAASPGLPVIYSATDAGGQKVGSFSSTTASAKVNGEMKSTATFNALGGSPGTVTIRATVGGVTATTTIVIS